MPVTRINVKERDIIRLVLEFMNTRSLHISMLSLERESGVINAIVSDDMLFLRQLILDGQWDDVLEFIQPLESMKSFDVHRFKYMILKHKYLELLTIKAEHNQSTGEFSVDEIVKCLKEIEEIASSKEEFRDLCLLLTLPRLTDHADYRTWNPSTGRVNCYQEIYKIVKQFLPPDKTVLAKEKIAQGDRLVQLVVKGLLYESCVEFCQEKATKVGSQDTLMIKSELLETGGLTDTDLSLLSWLQALPKDSFATPFEQKSLSLDFLQLSKPQLEASWTEQILVTPIKPRQFPHTVMPLSRPRSAEIMTRSLNPHYDGLNRAVGLQRDVSGLMASSVAGSSGSLSDAILSRSFAGFQLNSDKKSSVMHRSIEKLFAEPDMRSVGSCGDLSSIIEVASSDRRTEFRPRVDSIDPSVAARLPPRASSTPPKRTCSPLVRDAAPADLRKTGADENFFFPHQDKKSGEIRKTEPTPAAALPTDEDDMTGSNAELFSEYRKQKDRIKEQLEMQEKRREDLQKQLMDLDQKRSSLENLLDEQMNDRASGCEENDQNANGDVVDNIPSSGASAFIRHISQVDATPVTTTAGRTTPTILTAASNPYAQSPIPPCPLPTLPNVNPSGLNQSFSDEDGCISPTPTGGDLNTSSIHNASSASIQTGGGSGVAGAGAPAGTGEGGGAPSSATSSLISSVTSGQMPDSLKGDSTGGADVTSPGTRGPTEGEESRREGVGAMGRSGFVSVTCLEDAQAIRAVAFHPRGNYYAVGSNSKVLRVVQFPNIDTLSPNHVATSPQVLLKRPKHHRGSIYCIGWSGKGDLIATGSNDKCVKICRFDQNLHKLSGPEMELTTHDGTVRDLLFLSEDGRSGGPFLLSGGAGDCRIHLTDCRTGTSIQSYSGHAGHVYSLYDAGGSIFVSGSQDKTVRLWDVRSSTCIALVQSPPPGSAAAAVCVDASGQLLAVGQEDGACVLWDIRAGGRGLVQAFRPHATDIRSARFTAQALYLLTASYDKRIILTDLHGDLTQPLPSVVVGQHEDKIIQTRWHPTQLAFVSTSADKQAICWALPNS